MKWCHLANDNNRTKMTCTPDDDAIHRNFCWWTTVVVSAMIWRQSLSSVRQLRRNFDDGRPSAEQHPRWQSQLNRIQIWATWWQIWLNELHVLKLQIVTATFHLDVGQQAFANHLVSTRCIPLCQVEWKWLLSVRDTADIMFKLAYQTSGVDVVLASNWWLNVVILMSLINKISEISMQTGWLKWFKKIITNSKLGVVYELLLSFARWRHYFPKLTQISYDMMFRINWLWSAPNVVWICSFNISKVTGRKTKWPCRLFWPTLYRDFKQAVFIFRFSWHSTNQFLTYNFQ